MRVVYAIGIGVDNRSASGSGYKYSCIWSSYLGCAYSARHDQKETQVVDV